MTGNVDYVDIVAVRNRARLSDIFRAMDRRAGRMQFAAERVTSAELRVIRFAVRVSGSAHMLKV